MTDSQESPARSDSFRRLKELLLSEEENRVRELEAEIAALKDQLKDKERLIRTIDPVLTDLLQRKIEQSKGEMAEALAPVMGAAIKKQVQEARDDVVDALYPVIGRMISKAVTESMKKLAASINERINKTFNFKLWLTGLKAKILGVSAGEVFLSETGLFRLEKIFLIDKRSGLLVAQAGALQPSDDADDSHVIAGMLTAIKTFVEDAFSNGQEAELQEIEYSDRTIRIDSGRYTYLAVVFWGVPGIGFNESLRALHTKIHSKYYKRLRKYNGDISELKGTASVLQDFFNQFKGQAEAEQKTGVRPTRE